MRFDRLFGGFCQVCIKVAKAFSHGLGTFERPWTQLPVLDPPSAERRVTLPTDTWNNTRTHTETPFTTTSSNQDEQLKTTYRRTSLTSHHVHKPSRLPRIQERIKMERISIGHQSLSWAEAHVCCARGKVPLYLLLYYQPLTKIPTVRSQEPRIRTPTVKMNQYGNPSFTK